MERIGDVFYLEVGDIVYSTITKKRLKVIGIEYNGMERYEGKAYFENSAGLACCASYSTYFKSAYHSPSEIDLSEGKGYFFISNVSISEIDFMIRKNIKYNNRNPSYLDDISILEIEPNENRYTVYFIQKSNSNYFLISPINCKIEDKKFLLNPTQVRSEDNALSIFYDVTISKEEIENLYTKFKNRINK